MVEEKFSLEKYTTPALKLFFFSCGMLLLFMITFTESIFSTSKYKSDVCSINYLDIAFSDINCIDGTISIVSMPCVLVYVQSQKHDNAIIYRNYEERAYILEKNANCSYLPITCVNDPLFTLKTIEKNLKKYFPPKETHFKCYSLPDNSSDHVLLYVPDYAAFYLNISLVSFGFIVGAIFLTCRFLLDTTDRDKKEAFKKFMHGMNNLDYETELIDVDEDEFEPKDEKGRLKSISQYAYLFHNNLTLSENIDRNVKQDKEAKMIHAIGYRTGRVGYKSAATSAANSLANTPRGSVALSGNSQRSSVISSNISINSNNVALIRSSLRARENGGNNKASEGEEAAVSTVRL